MRALRSSRLVRRIAAVAGASFLATTLVVNVASRSTSEPKVSAPSAPSGRPSLEAALTAFTGAANYYLKIPTIKGESTSSRHPDEIEVSSFQWGLNNNAGTATGATFQTVAITKLLDRATPLLMKAAAAGTPLGTIVLSADKTGPSPSLVESLTLTGAKVKEWSQGGSAGGAPAENESFAFASIKLTYVYVNNAGAQTSVVGCWNLLTHAGC